MQMRAIRSKRRGLPRAERHKQPRSSQENMELLNQNKCFGPIGSAREAAKGTHCVKESVGVRVWFKTAVCDKRTLSNEIAAK